MAEPQGPLRQTAPDPGPIVAPRGASPAVASAPETPLDGRYHIYEPNPIPWWVVLVWLGFIVFALVYLITSLLA